MLCTKSILKKKKVLDTKLLFITMRIIDKFLLLLFVFTLFFYNLICYSQDLINLIYILHEACSAYIIYSYLYIKNNSYFCLIKMLKCKLVCTIERNKTFKSISIIRIKNNMKWHKKVLKI